MKEFLAAMSILVVPIFLYSCSSTPETESLQEEQAIFQKVLKEAENGNRNSQYFVGTNYIQGIGVEANFTEGIRWLEQSAIQKLPEAEYSLGYFYCSN
jgi:TPR repeat protein